MRVIVDIHLRQVMSDPGARYVNDIYTCIKYISNITKNGVITQHLTAQGAPG